MRRKVVMAIASIAEIIVRAQRPSTRDTTCGSGFILFFLSGDFVQVTVDDSSF